MSAGDFEELLQSIKNDIEITGASVRDQISKENMNQRAPYRSKNESEFNNALILGIGGIAFYVVAMLTVPYSTFAQFFFIVTGTFTLWPMWPILSVLALFSCIVGEVE